MKNLILKNKKSDGNQIIYFEYSIEVANEKNLGMNSDLVFRYYKLNDITWRVELVTQPHEELPFRLFSEVFQLPNNSVPLSVVCGMGLIAIKEIFNVEVQYYSSMQFTIADHVNKITSNMR